MEVIFFSFHHLQLARRARRLPDVPCPTCPTSARRLANVCLLFKKSKRLAHEWHLLLFPAKVASKSLQRGATASTGEVLRRKQRAQDGISLHGLTQNTTWSRPSDTKNCMKRIPRELISGNRQRTKCTEHARQKIRPAKRLELYIFRIVLVYF